MTSPRDFFLSQLAALILFFVLPAIQYAALKFRASNAGRPELWFLPAVSSFRLVMRNLPTRHTLSGIRYRALLRAIYPAHAGISVNTYLDEPLLERQDFFLFPGSDQVLLTFRLESSPAADKSSFELVLTDKLGRETKRMPLDPAAWLLCDYTATVENYLNFDISLGRRVELSGLSLINYTHEVTQRPFEAIFPIDCIKTVG